MALHNVAAEPSVCAHRSLEIYGGPGVERIQTRAFERFTRKVCRKRSGIECSNGQADAVDGDAVARFDPIEDSSHLNTQRSKITRVFNRNDLADYFNDSGEHRQ